MSKLFNAKPVHWSYWIAISGLWLGILMTNRSADGVSWGPIVRYTGQIAWYLLAFTIYISLLTRAFPSQTWLAKLFSMRKHTGIAAFLFAVMHLIGEYMKRTSWGGLTTIEFLGLSLENTNTMFFAWLALLLMVPAFATSFAAAIKKLGFKKWKLLQRLVHIAFIFAALHVGLLRYVSGGKIDWEPIVTLAIYAFGYLFLVNRLDKKGRKKIFNAGKTGLAVLLLLIALPNPAHAGDGTGMDKIFEEIGIEKPAEWNSWVRQEKFDYLQSLGIYPAQGDKYQGQADLSEFYRLRAEQLDSQAEQPVAEPVKYSDAIDEATNETAEELPSEPKEPPNSWLKYYLAVVAIVMGSGMILASYKVDWLRAKKLGT